MFDNKQTMQDGEEALAMRGTLTKKMFAINPLFRLKKFSHISSIAQVVDSVRTNWYNYGYCVCCSKKASKKMFSLYTDRRVMHQCSKSCTAMYYWSRYACCELARHEPNFAYDAVIVCPVHGRQTFGTSD